MNDKLMIKNSSKFLLAELLPIVTYAIEERMELICKDWFIIDDVKIRYTKGNHYDVVDIIDCDCA